MKTNIQELRSMLSKLSSSPYANCIASNSTIKYVPFKGYEIWAGGMNPHREGTFEEIKEMIQQEINAENYISE